VESQNNFEINGPSQAPAIIGQYLEMIELPGWDDNSQRSKGHRIAAIRFLQQEKTPIPFWPTCDRVVRHFSHDYSYQKNLEAETCPATE
jgi:hypothetical protein